MCHNFGILDNLHEVECEARVRLVKQDAIKKNVSIIGFKLKKNYLIKM